MERSRRLLGAMIFLFETTAQCIAAANTIGVYQLPETLRFQQQQAYLVLLCTELCLSFRAGRIFIFFHFCLALATLLRA